MGIKSYKPTTPTLRYKQISTKEEVTAEKPYKPLLCFILLLLVVIIAKTSYTHIAQWNGYSIFYVGFQDDLDGSHHEAKSI